MSLKGLKPTVLTSQQYDDLETCKCGKLFFKYHDTSKNHYVSKCSNVKEEFNIKTRKWTLSKKQPCGELYVYYGQRPVFAEILKVENTKPVVLHNGKSLENRLRDLFRFLFVSNRTSTLDEINLIVRLELNREPRKIFYSPTTTVWMKEISRETFEDYQTRIFSKKIIEVIPVYKIIKPIITPNIINIIRPLFPNKVSVKPDISIVNTSQFIITSDSDLENESENESEDKAGSESENDVEPDIEEIDARGDSDIEDLQEDSESIYEEPDNDIYEENEETYDYDDD